MEKPIFSKCVSTGTRVYYIDVFLDKKQGRYITVSEIPTDRTPGNRKRQRIFIHGQNVERFAEAFAEAIEKLNDGAEG